MAKTKKKRNKWEHFRDAVRAWPRRLIYRQELLKYLSAEMSEELIDQYRLYMVRANFLKHIDTGLYRRRKMVPKHLTLAKCVELAYPGTRERKRTNAFMRKGNQLISEQQWQGRPILAV